MFYWYVRFYSLLLVKRDLLQCQKRPITVMSISSTGTYGSTALLNSDLFKDLFQDVDDIKQDIEDISVNKIPAIIQDISKNTLATCDISTNKVPNLILDISENALAIYDISINKTPTLS